MILLKNISESNRGCTVEKTDSVFLYKKVTDNKPIIKKLPKIWKNIDININNYYNKNIKVTKSNLLITKMAKGETMREKLKKIRKEQNLTQKSLSKSVNIHRTHYSMIESGRRNPSLKVAVSIKKALNYQYDDIFEKQ